MKEQEPKRDILRAFKKVQEGMRHHFEAKFKDLGLTGPQAMLLGILAHKGPLKVSDISAQMHLSNSTVSSIIDRLELQGYIERLRNQEDKRVVQVDLTEDFRAQAKDRFCGVDAEISGLLAKATDEQKQKIYEGFTLLSDLIETNKRGGTH